MARFLTRKTGPKYSKMELMKLPQEVLHIILVYAALARVMNERYCKIKACVQDLAEATHPALLATHLMDEIRYVGTYDWQLKNQHAA